MAVWTSHIYGLYYYRLIHVLILFYSSLSTASYSCFLCLMTNGGEIIMTTLWFWTRGSVTWYIVSLIHVINCWCALLYCYIVISLIIIMSFVPQIHNIGKLLIFPCFMCLRFFCHTLYMHNIMSLSLVLPCASLVSTKYLIVFYFSMLSIIYNQTLDCICFTYT